MARLYSDFIVGTTTDNPLTAGATTVNAAILASVPVVASPDIVVLTLDPEAAGNGPEIVYVTAHSSSATSATISRGEDSTSGVEHAAGTIIQQALTASDVAAAKTKFILVWSGGKGNAVVPDTTAEASRWIAPFDCTLISATPSAGIAPTGDSVDFEVELEGTTMFSTKPTIAATAKDGTKQAPSVSAIASTEVVTVYLTQVGSTLPGSNVAIALEIESP